MANKLVATFTEAQTQNRGDWRSHCSSGAGGQPRYSILRVKSDEFIRRIQGEGERRKAASRGTEYSMEYIRSQ